MPPKRIKIRENSEQSVAGARAGCDIPEDLMLCILTRLPVKSIHRFKTVCKPWRQAFSSPEFRKLHRAQFSQKPENQAIVIYGRTAKHDHHTLSLLKIDSEEKKKPTELKIPTSQISSTAEFVGCCNGLLCTANMRGGRWIILWNPALKKMCKLLPFPGLEYPGMASIGFGYNEEFDDFTVVRIVTSGREKNTVVGVEVYSANWDSWTTMEPGFEFSVFRTKNEAIVNGSPYWVAMVDEKEVLVCFDVREIVFKIVPLPDIIYEQVDDFVLVDLEGKLGALVCNERNTERVLSLDIWVFDDSWKLWSKNRSFGTIELKVERFLECLKNGKILVGQCLGEDGKVFVYDTETGGVEEFNVIDEAGGVEQINVIDNEVRRGSLHIYGYAESLADGLNW